MTGTGTQTQTQTKTQTKTQTQTQTWTTGVTTIALLVLRTGELINANYAEICRVGNLGADFQQVPLDYFF